jgi:hypothetical protein
MTEVLWAMMLIALMAAALATVTGFQHANLRRLADARTASRLAESVLTALQSRQAPLASVSADARFSFHALPDPVGHPAMVWVEVDASFAGRPATLIGLAPRSAIPPIPGAGR